MKRVRVVVVGLGPIGIEVARAVLSRPGLSLVGAVDVAPELAGKRLSELLPGAPASIRIAGTLAARLARGGVDAVALTTSSRFGAVARDLATCVEGGVHVASTCEEMAAPAPEDTRLWRRLDGLARKAEVTLLGTGVNPGFVMDRLVLQLAGACVSVESVRVERVVDAARRRGPLRKKVGEGLTVDEFRAGVTAGRLGHVGLRQSALLIARGLGWTLDGWRETVDPAVGPDGKVLGVLQRGTGLSGGKARIALELQMFVGAPSPHDRVVLVSDPPLDVTIAGGTQGDRGTVGTMVNALERLPRARRGLVTVADVFC
jgi:4-hydroxy-tetrahydrodipicolinate reductase